MADNNYQEQNNVAIQSAVDSALKEEKKKKKKKKWIIIAVVVVVLIVICSALGSGSDDSGASNTTQPSAAVSDAADNSTAAAEQSSVFKKGDVAEVGKVKITYTDCDTNWTNYNQYLGPKDGYKVVRAVFTFENTGSADEVLNSFDCYADNTACDSYYSADDYKSPTLESLSSGRTFNAVVYFEVPVNAQEIVLEYETSYWTSNHIEFVIE